MPASAAAEGEAGAEVRASHATILVVEDDADVRGVVADQLEDLGYQTLTAANGSEALQLVAEKASAIDLVLTDVVMSGGMSGIDLLHALHARHPSLPVILTSGFMANHVAGEPGTLAETGAPILTKPYRQEDLARAVEGALGHNGDRPAPPTATRAPPKSRDAGAAAPGQKPDNQES
jgi:CheY-like chemotaxis protein